MENKMINKIDELYQSLESLEVAIERGAKSGNRQILIDLHTKVFIAHQLCRIADALEITSSSDSLNESVQIWGYDKKGV